MKKPIDNNTMPEEVLSNLDAKAVEPVLSNATQPDTSSSMTKMMSILKESSANNITENQSATQMLKGKSLEPTQSEDRSLLLKHYYASKKHGERLYLLRHYYKCKLGLKCPIHSSLSRRHRCSKTKVQPPFPTISKQNLQVRLNSSSHLLDALRKPINPFQQQDERQEMPEETKSLHTPTRQCDSNDRQK
mmetsp:Transcript_10312/g.14567  ORF Transcript_10312/g.14567 Transcript_10312/m.14567 type:complete len:190 (+) Transcript_10312:108-677(+)